VNPIAVAVSVVLLLASTVLVLRIVRIPVAASAVIAVARGAAQLAVVSVLLGLALTVWWAGAIVLLVMVGTAIVTASSRLREFPAATGPVALSILSGVTVTLVVVFGTGAFDFDARYVLAFSGIVIGGTWPERLSSTPEFFR